MFLEEIVVSLRSILSIFTQEIHDGKGGKDPFPLLLKKTKLPKKWKEKPGE